MDIRDENKNKSVAEVDNITTLKYKCQQRSQGHYVLALWPENVEADSQTNVIAVIFNLVS